MIKAILCLAFAWMNVVLIYEHTAIEKLEAGSELCFAVGVGAFCEFKSDAVLAREGFKFGSFQTKHVVIKNIYDDVINQVIQLKSLGWKAIDFKSEPKKRMNYVAGTRCDICEVVVPAVWRDNIGNIMSVRVDGAGTFNLSNPYGRFPVVRYFDFPVENGLVVGVNFKFFTRIYNLDLRCTKIRLKPKFSREFRLFKRVRGRLSSLFGEEQGESNHYQAQARQPSGNSGNPEHAYLGFVITGLPVVGLLSLLAGWGLFNIPNNRKLRGRPAFALIVGVLGGQAILWALMTNIPYGP